MNKIEDINHMVQSWSNSERITWNDYFMSLAILTSSRSPCSRLHVGCVLIKDKRVVSMGYNGFLTGEEHNSVVQEDTFGHRHELATIHAEQNAISYGANTGVALKETSAYITHYPCLNCAKLLVSCGIKTVYYHEDYNNDPLVPIICTQLVITKI
jgi:dCMP deaminase